MNLTKMEKLVLIAMDNSDYGDILCDPIWTFSVDGCVDRTSLLGVISSLVKKELIISDPHNDDYPTIEMTKLGAETYIEFVNPNPRKLISL